MKAFCLFKNSFQRLILWAQIWPNNRYYCKDTLPYVAFINSGISVKGRMWTQWIPSVDTTVVHTSVTADRNIGSTTVVLHQKVRGPTIFSYCVLVSHTMFKGFHRPSHKQSLTRGHVTYIFQGSKRHVFKHFSTTPSFPPLLSSLRFTVLHKRTGPSYLSPTSPDRLRHVATVPQVSLMGAYGSIASTYLQVMPIHYYLTKKSIPYRYQ